MSSCACSANQVDLETPMDGDVTIPTCCKSLPGPSYLSGSVAHTDPLLYNRNFLQPPRGGNYIRVPQANRLGVSTPFSNQIRNESGLCCSRLSNDCGCSPVIQYRPGEQLPGVYKGYESSCPCYPIDLPSPNDGIANYVPWTVAYIDDRTGKITNVINPDLVNIAPP